MHRYREGLPEYLKNSNHLRAPEYFLELPWNRSYDYIHKLPSAAPELGVAYRFWKYYYAINRFGICPIALANINDILSDVSHLYFVCQMQSSIIDVM